MSDTFTASIPCWFGKSPHRFRLLALRLRAFPLNDRSSAATGLDLGLPDPFVALLLQRLAPWAGEPALPPSLLLLQLATAVIVGAPAFFPASPALMLSCFCSSSAI